MERLQCKNSIYTYDARVLQYLAARKYRAGVLVGPWVEENRCYENKPHKHSTTYNSDYAAKPTASEQPALWKNRTKGAGLEAPMLFDYEGARYLENFSTTYDLSYKHLPKWAAEKRHERAQDFLRNYGNLTNYGLSDWKSYEWGIDNKVPKITSISSYKDAFVAPSSEEANHNEQAEYKEDRNPVIWESKIVCVKK